MGFLLNLSASLKVFTAPHFTPYKVYINAARQQVVFLNPKVGSTAFREALVEGLKSIGEPPPRGPYWPLNLTRRYTTATLPQYCDAFANPDRYTFHCFVRNPYARLRSAWNDKLVKGFHADEYPSSMRRLVPKLRRFAAERGLPGAEDDAPFPFASFIAYVESQPEGKRNQHWDTQRSVLLADKIRYDHAYPIETEFAAGVANILTPLGISPAWIERRVARPANASGRVREPVYDEALAERAYRLYAKDFEAFGYDPESWRGL